VTVPSTVAKRSTKTKESKMNILERDSFLLGLFLMVIMLMLFKELVGVVALIAFAGLTLNAAITVVLNVYLLVLLPRLIMVWAPKVDV
jgi:hypothetical protein